MPYPETEPDEMTTKLNYFKNIKDGGRNDPATTYTYFTTFGSDDF
jgi:hypothetical protein